MTMLADLLSTVFEGRMRATRPVASDDRPIDALLTALVGRSGEGSARSVASEILRRYAAMDDSGKTEFFRFVTRSMDIDPARVRMALDAYEAYPARKSYSDFMAASEPRRQELLRRLNQVHGATQALVSMRSDLLRLARHEPELGAFDIDFRHLFTSWFNRGFLVLRPMNWQSPAHILEKIIRYEAVHAIDSWSDLRRRLEPEDRRCFAFFHPAMPDEPLIFVQVALTRGIPGSVQDLLAEDRAPIAAEEADTAVFYSISNCQAGLAGISFGNSLITQVAADLARALPALKTFVTLSPIPGLADWARASGLGLLEGEALLQATALYITQAKRSDGQPADPVARFHLGNGAIVHAVHGEADTSPKGRAQSFGAMVNYRYDLDRVEENHERFVAEGYVTAVPEVHDLARLFGAKGRGGGETPRSTTG
ncbi:MAG: malonyl-CoA decarboxylase [Pseudomonadota bacterium]